MLSVKDDLPGHLDLPQVVRLNRTKYDNLKKKVIACTNKDLGVDLQYGLLPTFELDEFLEYCDALNKDIVVRYPDFETNTVRKKIPPKTKAESDALADKTFKSYMASVDEAFFIANGLVKRLHEGEILELDYRRIFDKAGDIVERALSNVPFEPQTRFFYGPGASLSGFEFDVTPKGQPRTYKSRLAKLSSLAGELDDLELFFEPSLAEQIRQTSVYSSWSWDKLHQVPKNADKNRVITITSVLRKAKQKGIGEWIRKAYRSIRSCNINHNLDTCARDHQVLAWIASKTDFFDTYDFSSASDRITFPILEEVLLGKPRPNCQKLWDMMQRSSSLGFEWKGQRYTYRSFPMGYSFTFELESLIFFALTVAFLLNWGFTLDEAPLDNCIAYLVSTYGDDLIVALSRARKSFERFFGSIGFKLNDEKSFSIETSFRESCGADFNAGTFVRGFYVKTRHPTIRDFLRITNFTKVNYNVTDSFLNTLPFYRKIKSAYGLNLCKLSVSKLIGRNSIFTKDVPVSVLLSDEDTTPKFILQYSQTRRSKTWLDAHLLFDTDYTLLTAGEDESEHAFSFSDTETGDTLRLRSITRNDGNFFMRLSESWVDDLILKYDPDLVLL
jgi:hypothetical protein